MDEEKFDALLLSVMDGLSDEQKEKVNACRTAAALMGVLAEAGAALPDELLDGVAGGEASIHYCADCGTWFWGQDSYCGSCRNKNQTTKPAVAPR